MAFDFGTLLSNPNFLQGLGNAGQVIGEGGSFAEALNPADLIRQIQTQKAGQDILAQIFGSGGRTTPTTQASGGAGGIVADQPPNTSPMGDFVADPRFPGGGILGQIPGLSPNFGLPPGVFGEGPTAGESLTQFQPTPIGTAGPDAVTTKRTADGTTTTVQTPSEQNLSTFGTNVPPESITQPQGQRSLGPSPFFKSLFGV